jgi:hypothetical protein
MTQVGYHRVAAFAVLLLGSVQARAGEKEIRDFNVSIDRKPAGSYRMAITTQDDGTQTVTGQANVKVTYLRIYHYHYNYDGTEVWKRGRLVELRSSTDDDGERYEVNARADGNGLRVKVNGQEHTTRWDVWTTTYWRLADARFRNQGVPLIDADTGKDLSGTLQFVATQQLAVAGRLQNCNHYRLTGKSLQVDLWYDDAERLVREVSAEKGHTYTLELASIQR